MKLKIGAFSILIALSILLTACSGEQPIDLDAVDAKLTTTPETVTAGSPTKLHVEFEGMDVSETATVNFDIRIGEELELVDAAYEGDSIFGGTFTFPEKGILTVYVHLYVDDIHITKKKWVEVK